MKTKIFTLFFVIIHLVTACSDTVTETITYFTNEPVFMTADAFRTSVTVSDEQKEISDYGKICFYEGYLYISEREQGIHILDNRNPEDPKLIGFIELIGNADLSVRNDLLYADSYVDLVWFDVSNPAQPELKGRLENVFPMALPSIDNGYGYEFTELYDGNKHVIVGWELKEKTHTYTYETGRWSGNKETSLSMFDSGNSGSGGNSGINGSMSRFTLYRDYLYTVINNYMSVFDLSGEKPVKSVEDIYIGGNVETIFSYKENMFMGTPTGMMIYSVANPLNPQYQSFISHVFGCDPVVVEDDIAYVTIHSGNTCGQNSNELLIYDVSDVRQPKHIVSYAMTNPKGLGIDSGTLFLCDDGLKIFNATDPQIMMGRKLAHYSGMDGYDVIPFNNTLMMIADNGLYQYDYTDLQSIRRLSMIPIKK
jgi:hypothetical protein